MQDVASLTKLRLSGLDHLRFMAVVFVVALHAAWAYAGTAPPWMVVDTARSTLLSVTAAVLDVPFMAILFFLAGYFAWESLLRYGPGRFAVEKTRRIGLVWIVSVVAVAPLLGYLTYRSRGGSATVIEFPRDLFFQQYFHQSVYWFLGLLYLLFLLTAVARRIPVIARWAEAEPDLCSDASRTGRYVGLVVFGGATAILVYLVHRTVPLDAWRNWGYVLTVQPSRLPLYVALYAMGFVAGRGRWLHREWLRDERAWPRLWTWGPAAVISMGAYVLVTPSVAPRSVVTIISRTPAVAAMVLTVTAFTWLFFSIAVARDLLQRGGSRWERASKRSYEVFVLHPLILYPSVYALRLVPSVPAPAKFVVVTIVTVVAAWLIAEASAAVRRRVA